MKKLSILFVFFGVLMFGCEEITPPINLEIRPTGRRVVIEEFTGVRCVNCPEASKKLEELLGQNYGDYIIPIAIHSGSFSVPYEHSLYDFRTPEGDNLEGSLLGPVQGFPAASINRRIFDNEDELPLTLNKWAGYIVQEILRPPMLEVDIENSFDTTDRNLEVVVDLDFSETVTQPLGISIVIVEDGIVDYQFTNDKSVYPDGKIPDYVHKHVLRTMLTDYTGDAISPVQTSQGSTPTFTYNFTMPDEWVAQNCKVVAFVSYKGGNSLDVLQANQAGVIDK